MSDRVPAQTGNFAPANRLLAALPGAELSSLEPYLEIVPLRHGCTLLDVNEPLTSVYFVETGVAALLAAFENRRIGVAVVGPEGAVDLPSLVLGGNTAFSRALVMVPGSALAMEVPAFRSALRNKPGLRAACNACTRALLVQVLQAVPCNRLHTVEQRCARWLLMCADRTRHGPFELAPECLADMLGAPQSSALALIDELQRAQLIGCHGNSISIVDRPALEAAACECYRIVRDRNERHLTGGPD